MDHGKMGHSAQPVAGTSVLAEGEVRKIDLQAQTITLKHGAIKNIDMPAMTMPFKVANPIFLTQTKVGDKVRFSADMPSGVLTLTRIELAK
ncbi:MAG: copper-binding protein [Rhodoferax sp.]|nr:copper-binding protein [Rhodoferax sp.]MCF8208985.1 copper-binding protein [Rhodoferax sp.]